MPWEETGWRAWGVPLSSRLPYRRGGGALPPATPEMFKRACKQRRSSDERSIVPDPDHQLGRAGPSWSWPAIALASWLRRLPAAWAGGL